MNKLRQLSLNPNIHLALSLALLVASKVPSLAPFEPILSAVGMNLIGTGILLPENGSLHAKDYAAIAGEIADKLQLPGK